MRTAIAVVAIALLGGCSADDSLPAATAQVARFHAAFNTGRYDRQYAIAAPAFRRDTPADRFARGNAALKARLGAIRAARRTGWRVGYGMRGGTIMLQYDTRFDRGEGIETFVFDTGASPPALVDYGINSPDLPR